LEKKRRYIIKQIRKSKYFALYLYMLLVLMLLTSVASYAWFTMSKPPRVSNMNMYITSNAGLELSAHPVTGTWSSSLDVWETEELARFKDKPQNEKPILKQITWSDSNDSFYAPVYGYDGRLINFINEYPEENRYIISWHALEDKSHANKATLLEGYYMKATFYARSGQFTDVRLAPTPEQEHIIPTTKVEGEPNTGRGPESAVRLGFRMTNVQVDTAGNVVEMPDTRSKLYVYEPNSDVHADGSQDYIETWSIDTDGNWDKNGDANEPLVPAERLIIQNFPEISNLDQPGAFVTNPILFSLEPGDIVRIELYFWLEGQDVDCSNIMEVRDAEQENEEEELPHLIANIQFVGRSEDQSGMEPIPDDVQIELPRE